MGEMLKKALRGDPAEKTETQIEEVGDELDVLLAALDAEALDDALHPLGGKQPLHLPRDLVRQIAPLGWVVHAQTS